MELLAIRIEIEAVERPVICDLKSAVQKAVASMTKKARC